MANQKQVIAVKEQYERQWLAMDEVTAIGIGKAGNEMGIIISVTQDPEQVRKEIPSQITGVPIKIQRTGEIRAQ